MVCFVFSLILIRTTMDPLFPSWFRHCDVLLPFVVYLGQRRNLPEGLILTLFSSHIFSLCSAAPIGVFTTNYLLIFIVARLLSYVVYANGSLSILVLIFSLTLLSHFTLALIVTFFGHSWGVFAGGISILLRALLNSALGGIIYGSLVVLDRMTFKAPRINIELSEGEL